MNNKLVLLLTQANYLAGYYLAPFVKTSPVFPTGALNSSKRLSSACKPAQALKILFNPSFYLFKEFTKGQSKSVKGALHKYPKVDKTLLNP